jgi:hypothetical protein
LRQSQWANLEPYCNGWRLGYWTSHSPWEVPLRKCLPYAPSNHPSDVHQPKDLLCQRPLVVCTDVAAIVYASDCWCQSQQSTLSFIWL